MLFAWLFQLARIAANLAGGVYGAAEQYISG
jgi:hypothetical protein